MYHGHLFVNILPLFIQLIIFHDELLPFSEGCKSEWTGKRITYLPYLGNTKIIRTRVSLKMNDMLQFI